MKPTSKTKTKGTQSPGKIKSRKSALTFPDEDPEAQALERVRYEMQTSFALITSSTIRKSR
jgi:hypothetical protein